MPTIGAKVNQEEFEGIRELANRQGLTISNLIKMLAMREIALTIDSGSNAAIRTKVEENYHKTKSESATSIPLDSEREESRLDRILNARRNRAH